MKSTSITITMAGETVAGVRVGKGKRTGVIVGSQQDVPLKDGMEDVEAVFAAVQSPEPELNPVSPGKENDTETVEKKVKAKKIRFSMPGGDERSEHDDVESSSSAATPGERHGIMSKYLNMKQRDRTSLSPSEISRVSTAPPSMDRSAATHLEEEEDEETEEEEEDVEEVRKAAAKSTEEESTVLHRREIGSPDAFPMDVDPGMDDDFPPADDNDDDGDDMVPPPPPASPEADDLETEEVELVEESATNVAFPSELDRDLDDDDDEDDKEGEAFNMADDPETPASVRKERVREERRKKAEELAERKAEELAEKKRKKKNGSKTRRLVDESMEEEEAPKSVPRKAKKQKQKYTTNPFTPKGIPSGPREFEAVPVSDLKDSPKQGQEHLRRSRRARMTPLEYWRNERIIYGPNYDTQYESLANMPVPKEVSKALPTPYKKRKVTHRAAPAEAGGKSKKAVSKEYANADDEPFDSTNLRKKQEYMDSDSEVANVWDEVAEESAGQSTSLVLCTLRCIHRFNSLFLTLVSCLIR